MPKEKIQMYMKIQQSILTQLVLHCASWLENQGYVERDCIEQVFFSSRQAQEDVDASLRVVKENLRLEFLKRYSKVCYQRSLSMCRVPTLLRLSQFQTSILRICCKSLTSKAESSKRIFLHGVMQTELSEPVRARQKVNCWNPVFSCLRFPMFNLIPPLGIISFNIIRPANRVELIGQDGEKKAQGERK